MPELPKKLTVTFEDPAFSNMLTLNALVELLTEKDVLTQQEILERVKKLRSENRCREATLNCPAYHFVVVRAEPTFPLHLECSNGKTKTGEPECQSSVRFR